LLTERIIMRKVTIYLIVIAMMIPVFSMAGSIGVNYYVSTSGNNANDGSLANPWRDINYAVNTVIVISGDTVNVAAGTYQEQIYVNGKNVSLIGESTANTIIDGRQTIVGSSTTHEAGIRMNNVHNVVVRNFHIKDVAEPCDANDIQPNQYGIVLTSGSANNLIENLHITNPGFYGIFIWNQCTANTIQNCYVDGYFPGNTNYLAYDGVLIHGGDNTGEVSVGNNVLNCVVDNCVYGVSLVHANNGLIEGNILNPMESSIWIGRGYFSYGVHVYTSSGNKIKNNKITGGYHNIRIQGSLASFLPQGSINNVIAGNDIIGTSTSLNGIFLRNTGGTYGVVTGNVVIANKITGNKFGVQIDYIDNIVQCNSIYGNTTGLKNNAALGTVTTLFNYWGASDGPLPTGSGNIVLGSVVYDPWSTNTIGKSTHILTVATTILNFGESALDMDFSGGSIGSGGNIIVGLSYAYPTGSTPGATFASFNSVKKVWSISSDMTGFTTDLIFYYDDADIPVGVNEATLIPMRSIDGGLTWQDVSGTVTRDTVANWIKVAGVTGFSLWAFGDSNQGVPVELSDFKME
jgi:hypothetical protein